MEIMRVLVITGAGISAESGIPTFRGKDGYWRNLDPMQLATPEAFARNPRLVWEWYNERREKIRAAQPNPAHEAIVDLAARARDLLLVTQNVDDLHLRAGLTPDKMVQIHGDIFVNRCSGCANEWRTNLGDADIDQSRLAGARHSMGDDLLECDRCGGLMRPGVVWFGEMLDPRKIDAVEEYLSRGDTDLTLVVGTTALFGYILDWATRPSKRLVEINPEMTPISRFAAEKISEPAAKALPRLISEMFGATGK